MAMDQNFIEGLKTAARVVKRYECTFREEPEKAAVAESIHTVITKMAEDAQKGLDTLIANKQKAAETTGATCDVCGTNIGVEVKATGDGWNTLRCEAHRI